MTEPESSVPSVRVPAALPDGVSQATIGVRGGLLRSGFEETAEALYLTSGYVYPSAADAEKAFSGEIDRYVYSRYGNPTITMFEERLRLIEGAPAAFATVILERASGTDARVICVGHTHVPEVRELGWKVIVNAGSAGYVFDGDPTASWALVTIDDAGELSAEIRRTPYDALTVANAISARGLPGDVYRAATVRTGKLVR